MYDVLEFGNDFVSVNSMSRSKKVAMTRAAFIAEELMPGHSMKWSEDGNGTIILSQEGSELWFEIHEAHHIK